MSVLSAHFRSLLAELATPPYYTEDNSGVRVFAGDAYWGESRRMMGCVDDGLCPVVVSGRGSSSSM